MSSRNEVSNGAEEKPLEMINWSTFREEIQVSESTANNRKTGE